MGNLEPHSVSVVIPTRGDCDIEQIRKHLRQYPEIYEIKFVVGASVYGRYAEAGRASRTIVYTQDDDCITDLRPILNAFRPGSGTVVHAMTAAHAAQYRGRTSLVGFGAIFDRELLHVFDGWEMDELFLRECDRVFTALVKRHTVYPEIRNLPNATAADRLSRDPRHGRYRREIERRIEAFLKENTT